MLTPATTVVFVLGLLATAASGAEEPPAALTLGSLPLLFADDAGLTGKEGVTRTVHPGRTSREPVLTPDRPWEGGRVYLYGSVYRDDTARLFHLWYGSIGAVLYATSTDGLRWDKPSLGLQTAQASKNNNIVYFLHSPSVLLDSAAADPSQRYKMLGSKFVRDGKTGKADMRQTGYYAAVSPDGLNWQPCSTNPAFSHWDTVTLTQDPRTGDYLAFHKRHTDFRGHSRRVVWLARSRDFQTWSEPDLVFGPDEEDDAWATRPEQRTDIYNMTVLPHAAGFIGLPALFRVTAANRPNMVPGQSPDDGPITIQLATSADGKHWARTVPRAVVIPNGPPGAFDAGCILGVSSTAVHVGDETWLYYTGVNTTHGGPLPPKRIQIGRAVWRLHGFASLDAAAQGRVVTQPLRLAAPALAVNADARGGSLRLGVTEADGRPIPGLAASDCAPLCADAAQHAVTWLTKAAPPTNRPVRVVIEMTACRLFSLSSSDEHRR